MMFERPHESVSSSPRPVRARRDDGVGHVRPLMCLLLLVVTGTGSCATSTQTMRPTTAERPEEQLPASRTNSIGMRLMLIQAGSFLMGSPKGEAGRWENEGPQHEVVLTTPFYLGECEVAEQQYEAVMGSNASEFKGGARPVDSVSWFDAVSFCERLSQREGRFYRLPTEAEWEYACRAGSTSAYHFGDDPSALAQYANYNRWLGDLIVYVPSAWGSSAVRTKKPNAWGLYDMHGNVMEWCRDWYEDWSEYYYRNRSLDMLTNPQGRPWVDASYNGRTVKGGTWGTSARNCRSAHRCWHEPTARRPDLGFRVVREVGEIENARVAHPVAQHRVGQRAAVIQTAEQGNHEGGFGI